MDVVRRLVKNPTSLLGIVLLLGFVIVAIAAPFIAPPEENARNIYIIPRDGFSNQPRPPSEAHPLGTTEGQYDILYGVVWGTRTAFRVGIVITLITTFIGLIVGSLAGFYGGWVDEVLMRITEVFLVFPFLLAAITLTSVLQTVYGRGEANFLVYLAKGLAIQSRSRS